MKNKYISFARCSTKTSADGHSPADQHAKNKEFIANRGGECIREFTLAISGKKMLVHEGALKNILRIAKEEDADVVVAKMDRISRKASAILQLRDLSEAEGIEVWIAHEGQTLAKKNLLLTGIEALIAEQERELIKLRVGDASHKSPGAFGHGKAKVNPRLAAKRAAEAKREKFRLYAEGIQLEKRFKEIILKEISPTLRQLSDELNLQGITTVTGKEFTHGSVNNAIKALGYESIFDMSDQILAANREEAEYNHRKKLQKEAADEARARKAMERSRGINKSFDIQRIQERGSYLNEQGQLDFGYDYEEEATE